MGKIDPQNICVLLLLLRTCTLTFGANHQVIIVWMVSWSHGHMVSWSHGLRISVAIQAISLGLWQYLGTFPCEWVAREVYGR